MNIHSSDKSKNNIYKSISEEQIYEELIYLANFKKQVEEGIKQLDNGETLSNGEVKERLKSSINKILLR